MQYKLFFLSLCLLTPVFTLSTCGQFKTKVGVDFEPDQVMPDLTFEIDFSETDTAVPAVAGTDKERDAQDNIEQFSIVDNMSEKEKTLNQISTTDLTSS